MIENKLKRDLPAYLEYASDSLANRNYRLMSLTERGLLDTMRKECWVNLCVPADRTDLAKILLITESELHMGLTTRVLCSFVLHEGSFYCPELDKYREMVLSRRELQSKGGSKGGLKTQNAIREVKGNLEGEVKVLNRDEMQREEKTRRESSGKGQEYEENSEWLEQYDKG